MPVVSVIVPTYNRAHLLPASLASVLAEDVDLELIVVDDGSSDGTAEMVAAMREPRLRVIERPHAGIAAARNAGVDAARAPVIAFHDSDDLALAGRLTVPLGVLRARPDVDLVIQNGRMLPPEDAPHVAETPWIPPPVARRLVAGPVGVAEVFRWNLGQLQGMCFTRRSLAAAGPLDGSFRILDDLDLVLRVAAAGRAVFLDRPAFAYRRHPAGVARDRATVSEEAIRLADKLACEHPEAVALIGRRTFARRQARRHARLARERARAGDRPGARAALARARALDPGNPRYLLQALVGQPLGALWAAVRSRG